ncbi:MAG TPA: GLPGLI family protein [Bacteroidales bacterium]|nr:GLPGLI family protein [Bacteroidales bacterium]
MKKIFLSTFILFFLIIVSQRSYSQQSEGMVKYLTTYDWVKMLNACDYLSKERKDRTAYMWGNESEWKVYNNLYFSSTRSKYEDSEEKANPEDDGSYAGRKETFFMTCDFEKNTMYNAITTLGKVYLIADSLNKPDWKILNDMKEVAGHVCMNAAWVDTVQDKKIMAWFALDIPVQAGPDRFFGLPGMILEVSINNGAMVMTAEKIEMKTLTTEFDLPKKLKGKKITSADYNAILKKFYDEKRQAEEFPWGVRY